MDTTALAELLFPGATGTVEELEARFPPRQLPEGARVTRMAPSPTGFMHLGNLYGAIADERLAHQSQGVFFLRIEDTDQKREVEGGVQTILDVFQTYQLPFDEGVGVAAAGAGLESESGAYGPYRQRQRVDIYRICAKHLLLQGKAYPCFLTEEELAAMRESQAEQKVDFGCYGDYAIYRNSSVEDIKARIDAGQPYVVRYRSEGSIINRVKVTDLIRGTLELPENNQDVVLLKADGIPTYHFAHVVDDHFMRTNLVVRGEEWLATLPIHLQLFGAMGWKPPKYLHTAHLMKQEGGSKRKLSKRKDPELALSFYSEKGYPVTAVKEYLLVLLNSNFEDWRIANPDADLNSFPFSVKKMSVSGALFDIDKLNDVSKSVICRLTAAEAYGELTAWTAAYAPRFDALLRGDEGYAVKALSIGRECAKPRKDITVWSDAEGYLGFFYDELFGPDYTLPEHVDAAKAREILEQYGNLYSPLDDSDGWFGKVKALAASIGFADNMKDYKKDPAAYGGHVGDVSMVLRLAITGRAQSPDLYEVMQVLGPDRVRQRLQRMAAKL